MIPEPFAGAPRLWSVATGEKAGPGRREPAIDDDLTRVQGRGGSTRTTVATGDSGAFGDLPGADSPRTDETLGERRLPRGVLAFLAVVVLLTGAFVARPAVVGAFVPPPAGPAEPGQVLPAELPGAAVWKVRQSWSPLPRVAVTLSFPSDEDIPVIQRSEQLLLGDDLHSERYLDARARALVSPDGRRLAYVDDEFEDAVRVDDLETGGSELIGIPGEDIGAPLAWSPDSGHLYVGSRVAGEVWVATLGGSIEGVPAAESDDRWHLAPSPDGTHLAVGEKTRMRIVDRRAAPPAPGSSVPPTAEGGLGETRVDAQREVADRRADLVDDREYAAPVDHRHEDGNDTAHAVRVGVRGSSHAHRTASPVPR